MTTSPILRLALRTSAAALLLAASCAHSSDVEDVVLARFDTETPEGSGVCVDSVCPAPYATCTGALGPCTIDTRSDIQHCGACDSPCPRADRSTHGSFVCTGGECHLACDALFADCNGDRSDGCETRTSSDPENCGACGISCGDDLCWRGACGCPNGLSRCGDDCKDLAADNQHCGACGTECRAPDDLGDPRWTCGPGVMPAATGWTCADASCLLLCMGGFDDCNDSFCGDGCETNLRTDPENCGACGNACAPGQRCKDGACACPPGTVECDGKCVDTQADPSHCGMCRRRWPGPATVRPGQPSSGSPACVDGSCTYVCFPGYADCDAYVGNGCEVDLRTSQRNCGACRNACNVAAGQPCIEGACLTKACDPPRVIR